MLIQPPSNITGGGGSTDANRYLQSQLSVLRSLDLAEKTASTMGGTYTRQQVSTSVRVIERAGTDVVDMFAKAPTASEAARLADLYVHTYLEDLSDQRPRFERQDARRDSSTWKLLVQESRRPEREGLRPPRPTRCSCTSMRTRTTRHRSRSHPTSFRRCCSAQVAYDTTLQQYTEQFQIRPRSRPSRGPRWRPRSSRRPSSRPCRWPPAGCFTSSPAAIAGAVIGLFACVIVGPPVANKVVDDTADRGDPRPCGGRHRSASQTAARRRPSPNCSERTTTPRST